MEVGASFLPSVARMDCYQLSHLYHAMFTIDVSDEIINQSIERVCGKGAQAATQTQILPVLQEIHDKRVLEENAYWDFRALVVNDTQTLSPKDTLLFLRILHGETFSTAHWESFVKSRTDPSADVSWYEVKPWVCAIPDEGDLDESRYKMIENDIELADKRRNEESLQRYTARNQTKHAREMFQYSRQVKKKSQIKVNLWEQEGLTPFLADEQEDVDVSRWQKKDNVVATDVLDLIDEKYSRLRLKLLTLMIKQFSGDTTWEILSETECHELIDELITEERRMRLSGLLPTQGRELPGATLSGTSDFGSLKALMGELGDSKGNQEKRPPQADKYWDQLTGTRESYGEELIALFQRYQQEIDQYKYYVRHSKERKSGNESYYCQLQRQLLLIDGNDEFNMATVAVGLAERTSKEIHREVDRKRQEYLATTQLSSHTAHNRASRHSYASSSMTTSELNSLDDRDLFILIIKQIQAKHMSESRVMGSLLHHRSSRSHKSVPTALMKEEVIRQLTVLGNRRATWRDANDEYKTLQKDEHKKTLQQALAIYHEAEAKPMFADYKTHEQMDAAILSLLYRKQGHEFDQLITEMSRKKKTALIEILKREERVTMFEHCDNIAGLLFGSVESGEVDKMYVEQLAMKYLAYRHQIIQYSLSKKFGDSWYSRSADDQQRHTAKMAITLKELLDQGKLDEMDALVADTTQHISMYQCLGENRLQFEKRMLSGQTHSEETMPSEPGVFGSLHSRYFSEYAAVLEAAHKVGDKEPKVLLALLKAETFVVEQSGDLRIALFLTGLVERLGAVFDKRHTEDLIRVGNLAKCLVSSHRLLWRMQGKQPKCKSDVYCDSSSSMTEWVECVLKEMLCRHIDERYMLLKIVLDDSLRELREVADLQSKEEQHRRLVALQNMHRWLLFDTPDARDENIALMEEAAAIQMCMMYDSLINSNQPADVDSIAVLLTDKLLLLQEKDLAYLIKDIETLSIDDLMKLHSDEADARHSECCKNVAKVLTAYTGIWSDEVIISEIDAKFSLLETLMLESTLRSSQPQLDTMEANRRAQLCAELKAKTEQYRLAGNNEAMLNLYSPIFVDEKVFFMLFGENSFEFAHKIVDFQNVDNLPTNIYSVPEDSVAVNDPITALNSRKEEEKQTYQNLLRGMYEVFLGEQGRAAEVINLRHHQSMIKSSADFANVALQLGLKERCQLVTHITRGTGDHKMLMAGDWERIVTVSTKAVEDGDVTIEDISSIIGTSSTTSKLFVDMLHIYIMRQKQERLKISRLIAKVPQTYQQSALLLPIDEKLIQLQRLRQCNMETDVWSDDDVNRACGIKLELWEKAGGNATPINSILAELEEKHLFELSNIVHIIADKTVKDLEHLRDNFRSESCPCVYLALTDTSHFSGAPADEIPKAIENKYDTLRDKLILDSLMIQMDEDDWTQISDSDRQKRLLQVKLKERELLQKGQQQEAAALFTQYLADKRAYSMLLSDNLEQEEAMKDEEDLKTNSQDILEYIQIKREQELGDVMTDMSTYKNAEIRQRKEQEELTRIRRDQRRLNREGQFGAAAVLLKTLVRTERNEKEARDLQDKLARERISARKNGAKNRMQVAELPLPEPDNHVYLQDGVLDEMDLKHAEEREILMRLVEEAPHTKYHQQSVNSNISDQEVKLTDLCDQRRQLRDSAVFDNKEQEMMYQEGVCYKLQLRIHSLQEDGKPCTMEDAVVTLLADLQQLQEQEMNSMYHSLQHKTTSSLREQKGAQAKARAREWYDHVAVAVLNTGTIDEALNPEHEVITALHQKYDTLKDKLILEGLMNQMGESEWQALDQKQRQQKLIELKLQEKRLKEDGKQDEAKKLISDLIEAEQALRLSGMKNGIDCMKADQGRLLQEKAEALRKRLKSNPANKDKLQEELQDVENKSKRMSVLENLTYEHEEEKERLIALLHSQKDEAIAERIKQLEMAKLRRQKKLLKKEGELDEASAVIHLARKNEDNRLAGLASNKDMQMELARRRLAARRAKGNVAVVEKPTTPTALVRVQDRVLEALGRKHSVEMSILMNFFTAAEEDDYLEQVLHISNVKLRKALEDLETQCSGLLTVCKTQTGDCVKEKDDLTKLLNKTFLYHLIVNLRAAHGDQASDYTIEKVREACTILLAELQESQDKETASTSQLMITEEDPVLEKLADAYNISTGKGQYDNLIAVLFAVLDDEKKWTIQQVNMDNEFETEKQEILDAINRGEDVIIKDGQEVDAQELLKQLEAEYAAQKTAIAKQMEKQNEMMMARRRSKKQARFEEDSSIARKLLDDATADESSHKTAEEKEKNKQGDMMSERLATRKASRNKREELDRQEELERHVRPKSVKDAFGNVMQFVPPLMGMKRERTVVNVSDEQKDKEWQKLVKEKHRAEMTQSQEQRKQEQMIRARREQRKLRRHSEVEAIFSMGEKQKTMFERSSSENREKQLSTMKERIARIQNEKTMTYKPTKKATSFEHLVDPSKGASKDEQMKALAANLQKRFADESQGVKEGKTALKIGQEGTEDEQPTRILSQEEKQKILKERRLAKRKNREAAATSDE